MSELVLRSASIPDTYKITTQIRGDGRVAITVVNRITSAGLTLSADSARQLRDFLNKELGEQASGPMGTDQAVYLETDSWGTNTWKQFPTPERAKSFANKQFAFSLKYQAVAVLHQQLVPVVTTTYEWKDIG